MPIAFAIASVILFSAASGWFLFRNDTSAQSSGSGVTAPIQLTRSAGQSVATDSQYNIDADLRKARLAADADLIATPPRRNALYYYGRVLKADPDHRLAIAESAVVLARATQMVNDNLAAGNYEDAYVLAARVTAHGFEHPLVDSIQNALTDYATGLFEQAREFAEDGDDAQAMALLTDLEQLSGLNEEFIVAARESVVDIQRARNEALQSRRKEDERLNADKAASDWAAEVRGAIESGRLISPEDNSARYHLATRATPVETKKQLTEELLAALATASDRELESGNLAEAESYLSVAYELAADAADILGSDGDPLTTLLDAVESELIAAEGKKVMGLSDFVQISTVPPEYPYSAGRREISGWVELLFTVTASGETADIQVLRAKPKNLFDGSAIEAVEQWMFQPREYRGRPIDQRTAARLVFEVE